jgi:hypothetical protein
MSKGRYTKVTLFGSMRVIDTDQLRGRKYRCACGWEGWSVWGHARKHAQKCPHVLESPHGNAN